MKKFKLYQSGIFYGNIYFDNNNVSHEKLNPFTNLLEELRAVNKDDEIYYNQLLKRNLLDIAKKYTLIVKSIESATANNLILPDCSFYARLDENTWVQRKQKFPMDILCNEGSVIGFMFTSRDNNIVLVEEGKEDFTIIKKWRRVYAEESIYAVDFIGTFNVLMRDGIKLATDVFLPNNIKGTVPAILIRTPYDRTINSIAYHKYVQRGYAVVIQDVRGRNHSEGEWEPCIHEIEDGDDTLNWIASQEWSSKRIGMLGGSYLGFVQWAAAASGNKYLKALGSIVTSGSAFVDIPRRGGAFTSGMLAWGFAMSQRIFAPEKMARDDWDDVLNIRPLQDLCQKALGYDVPFVRQWLDNYDCDAYWDNMNWHKYKDKINVPALIMSGWFDDNGMGTTEALDIVANFPVDNRKVILGPWIHSANTTRDIHNFALGDNALRADIDYLFFTWFDKHLKQIDNGIDKTAPVEYYTMGTNSWKEASAWPLPNIDYKPLYLTENKGLSFNVSANGSNSYIYDPANPAPHLIDMSENELEVPENYTEVEKREDILCFSTETLTEGITITGDFDIEFYASSSAPDTDWVVRITDVDPQGNSIKLSDGILSARYRNSFYKSEFMEEGQIYKFNIRTTKLSNTFLPGHKIRFTITSSAKNFIFPNSNTKDGYNSTEIVKAKNTIYFGKDYPSKIVLPIEI